MHRLGIALLTGALIAGFPIAATAQAAPTAEQLALQWLQCRQQRPNGQIGPDSDNPIARSAELVTGLADTVSRLLATVPSRFLGEIYSAVAEKP